MYRKAKLGKTHHLIRESDGGGLFSVLAAASEKELDNVLAFVANPSPNEDGSNRPAELGGYTMVAVGKTRRWLCRQTIGDDASVRGVGWSEDEDELRALLKAMGVREL